MDQNPYVDNITTEDARGICDKTRTIHIARSLGSHAMAVHTDGCKKSMCHVNVTIFANSGYN